MPFDRISIIGFAASYSFAFAFELLRLFRYGKISRYAATTFGGAGLLAHSIFLALWLPALATTYGSLLFLAWVVAMFYFFGSFHHSRQSWSVFVLPVVLGLIALAGALGEAPSSLDFPESYLSVGSKEFWRLLHVTLFLLAATGISVGFVASVMYLVQAHRLRMKTVPGSGLRMLSLERLEAMNRRAIILSFPLLTAGLLVGTARMLHDQSRIQGWADIRILSTLALWIVFAILLYLRYGFHLRARRLAILTIAAFALLLFTLVTSHGGPTAGGVP
jgi:ABC-type transport system involved in cytochrome c biogenesis permease subunit